MIPGEYRLLSEDIPINKGRKTVTIVVVNRGDRPVQVGSHFHFFEVNRELAFDRLTAYGMRLNIPAGTAIRFEPGDEKKVQLTELGGKQIIHGFNNIVPGRLRNKQDPWINERLQRWEGGEILGCDEP